MRADRPGTVDRPSRRGPGPRVPARRLPLALLLAVVAAVGLLGIPAGPTAPAEVHAARPDLSIVTRARYEVQPDERRVRITVDLTLRNHLRDTRTRRFYFDRAYLAVLPGISGFRASWDGAGDPRVRATERNDDYTLLRLDLARRLYSGQTATYRLSFNLNDPGGAATRELRIGTSLVSFPVWAFGTEDTPGSSVTVVFPEGYDVQVEAGSIPDPETTDDGRVVFRTGELDKPLDFFAYLVADRPSSYTETVISPTVGDAQADIRVRSWPDDEPWAERVTGLLERGVPALAERIGLDWPHEDELVVEEAVSRSTGGYAGLFDPSARRVEIAYYADDFVVLHEAAHSWFNGTLLADRWANEAFASYYATEAAADLEIEVRADELTEELEAARIPLNAWGPIGSQELAEEDYAYAATLELARAIAERAGDERLQRVWRDAAVGIGAYRPPVGEPETVDGAPDWRGLLDLLEEHTDERYDDLWRTWVARPTDLPLLEDRAAARERLEAVQGETDGWRLPRAVRDAMRAWRFEDATTLLDGAQAGLEARAEVASAAEAADLIVPDTLRTAFEDEDGFDDVLAEAAAQLETIDRYEAAAALRPPAAGATPFVTLGLVGTTPEVDLEAARTAYAQGDLQGSADAAARAQATWHGAEEIGQRRALSLVLLAIATILALALLVGWIRRRRRRVDPAEDGPVPAAGE